MKNIIDRQSSQKQQQKKAPSSLARDHFGGEQFILLLKFTPLLAFLVLVLLPLSLHLDGALGMP